MKRENQALLDKMAEFELDAVKTGVVLMHECHRDPQDETKWQLKKMHPLFRLWQAGARYGIDRMRGEENG